MYVQEGAYCNNDGCVQECTAYNVYISIFYETQVVYELVEFVYRRLEQGAILNN